MISLRCIYSAELEYVSGWMDSVFFFLGGGGWGGSGGCIYLCICVYGSRTLPREYIYIFF